MTAQVEPAITSSRRRPGPVWFHFVTKVALADERRVVGSSGLLPQFVGQLGQEEGRLCLGFLQHIKLSICISCGDLAQHLVGEGGEHHQAGLPHPGA